MPAIITPTTNVNVSNERVQLLTAKMAMKMHVQSKGKMRLTRIATPGYIRNLLGLKGKTAAQLLKEIEGRIAAMDHLERCPSVAPLKCECVGCTDGDGCYYPD